MTIRRRDPLGPVDAHPSSRDAAALPIVLELAVLLESLALFLPARLPEVAADMFTKRAVIGAGRERRTAGEIIDELFQSGYPILLRSVVPNVPECSTFVLNEDGVAAWLGRWGDDDAREEQLGRRLAAHAGELETALTRRVRRWAGSDRPAEWTEGDRLPEGLDLFLRRNARQIAVTVTADRSERLTVRLHWSSHS